MHPPLTFFCHWSKPLEFLNFLQNQSNFPQVNWSLGLSPKNPKVFNDGFFLTNHESNESASESFGSLLFFKTQLIKHRVAAKMVDTKR